ncbi:MAG: lipase family protein [Nocardioides sp.]
MSRSTLPPITGVTGGVTGLTVSYASMASFADRCAATAELLREYAADDARLLADGDLLQSAPLSPVTFAEAEAAVAGATAGPHGLLEAAVRCEADALLVRGAVATYVESDRLAALSLEVLAHELGRAVGQALRMSLPTLAIAGLVAVPAWQHVSARTRARLGSQLGSQLEGWLGDHPEAVQHLVDGEGGVLDGLLGLPPLHLGPGSADSDLARLYPRESPPQVVRRPDLRTPLADVAPRDLPGLMRHLRQTNALSVPGRTGDQGTIEVQRLRTQGGPDRFVVYLPGTDDPRTAPWSHGHEVRDLPADLRVLAGEHAAYATGIEDAMAQAGIRPRDPVLLVGHSLGGMEAATLLAHGSPYRVTHVVTAGSPIAGVGGYPAGAHMLSLENRGDVVPLLDGRDNADAVQHVTVQFDEGGRSVLDGHDLRHYVHGAAAVAASRDPSIDEQLASLRAAGFVGSRARATSEVFQIVRNVETQTRSPPT